MDLKGWFIIFLMMGILTGFGYHIGYLFGYKKCEEDENSCHPEYFNDKIVSLEKGLAICTVQRQNFENLSREWKTELEKYKSDLDTIKERETKVKVDHASCKASMDAQKTGESNSKESSYNEMILNLEKDNVTCHTHLKHIQEKSDKCEAKYIHCEDDRRSFRDKTVELNNDLTKCHVTCKAQIENTSEKWKKNYEQRNNENYKEWSGEYEQCAKSVMELEEEYRDCNKKVTECEKKYNETIKKCEKTWF